MTYCELCDMGLGGCGSDADFGAVLRFVAEISDEVQMRDALAGAQIELLRQYVASIATTASHTKWLRMA